MSKNELSKIVATIKEYSEKHRTLRVEKPPRIYNVVRIERRGNDWVPESIKDVCPYLRNGKCFSPLVEPPSSAYVVPFRCMTVLHRTCRFSEGG